VLDVDYNLVATCPSSSARIKRIITAHFELDYSTATADEMQRASSDQTTQLQYNRHLAAYYRQQIAALQQGLPRWPPPSTAVAAVEDDSIDNIDSIDPIIIVDDPIAALDFPTQQSAQRWTSSSSMSACSPHDGGDVLVTSRERTESYESERSVLAATPDSAGSSKPAGPRTVSTGMGTASSPVPKKGLKSKARSKSGGKGLSRIFGRRRSGDD